MTGDPAEAGQTPPRRPRFLRPGERYDPAELRERTRSWLALGLALLVFVIATLLVVLTAIDYLSGDEAKTLAAAVLSPVVAVTGTALGFYFGAHRSGE